MSGIVETRNLKIVNKIIRSQDVKRLFNDLESEFNRLENITEEKLNQKLATEEFKDYSEERKADKKKILRQYTSRSIKITAFDGSIYEGESKEILANGGILDSKQIMSVRFYFRDNNHNVNLSISLAHDSDFWNEVSVTGTDSLWVNGVIQKIENFLDSLEAQSTWAKKYSLTIKLIFAVCIAYVSSNLFLRLSLFLTAHYPPDPNSAKISIQFAKWLLFFVMLGAGLFPGHLLTGKITKLWPNVELQTGYDYHQIEKQRRNRVWLIFTIVIIPTALTILIDFLGM